MEHGRTENFTMRALYLLGIVFIVDGHMAGTMGRMFEMNGLFPYYSFHLLLFAFGSGYFFRPESVSHPLRAIGHSARRLLIPLYAFNLLYGLFAALLRRFGGFALGQPLSAYTLLLAPMTDGEHFYWNMSQWFLSALFIVQEMYLLIRMLSSRISGGEGVPFVLCLALGSAGVQLCHTGRTDVLPLFLVRAMILLPGYAAGVLYREKLEGMDRLPTVPYLLGIVVLRFLLACGGTPLAYLLSKGTFFECGPFGVYAGAALAIAFWLRAARLLGQHMRKSPLLCYMGRHTLDIMMHHQLGFFAVNACFLAANMLGIGAERFSVLSFRTQEMYQYAPGDNRVYAVVYLLAGLLLPLAAAWLTDRIREKISGRGKI